MPDAAVLRAAVASAIATYSLTIAAVLVWFRAVGLSDSPMGEGLLREILLVMFSPYVLIPSIAPVGLVVLLGFWVFARRKSNRSTLMWAACAGAVAFAPFTLAGAGFVIAATLGTEAGLPAIAFAQLTALTFGLILVGALTGVFAMLIAGVHLSDSSKATDVVRQAKE